MIGWFYLLLFLAALVAVLTGGIVAWGALVVGFVLGVLIGAE